MIPLLTSMVEIEAQGVLLRVSFRVSFRDWFRVSHRVLCRKSFRVLWSAPRGPRPPMRFRKHRWMAEAVEPSCCGETSRIMMAAGARHASDRAKPTNRAAKDCSYSGASRDMAMKGAATIEAPARPRRSSGVLRMWLHRLILHKCYRDTVQMKQRMGPMYSQTEGVHSSTASFWV